jgi:tryptophan synthase alpha chain
MFSDGKLVIYLTCGDPSVDATVELVLAAARAGASVIELGVPFSEPSADGPAIRSAMERALRRGTTLADAFAVVRRVRAAGCDVFMILFGYYNPIFVHGVERFANDAGDADVDGVLVVDLPAEEADELRAPLAARGVALIPLVAPTSTPERIARAAAHTPPFLYYVSMTGVTGGPLADLDAVAARVAEVRAAAGRPIAVGFGIATPEDARKVGSFADGVVVGTAVVRAIEQNPGGEVAAVADLVTRLAHALE